MRMHQGLQSCCNTLAFAELTLLYYARKTCRSCRFVGYMLGLDCILVKYLTVCDRLSAHVRDQFDHQHHNVFFLRRFQG